MDENKESGKKESIDEILSDLNGLLNKMPALLEGIKLPEIQPVDFNRVIREDLAPAAPEPAPCSVPEREAPPVQKEDFYDKTIKLEEGRLPDIPAPGPADKDKLVLQSLGEYMYSGGDTEPPAPKEPHATLQAEPLSFNVSPAGMDTAPELPEIKPAAADTEPEARPDPEPVGPDTAPELPEIKPAAEEMKPADRAPAGIEISDADHMSNLESLMADAADIENVFKKGPENMEEEKKVNPLDATKDFGVPDIDAMIKLSQDEALPGTEAPVPDKPSAAEAKPEPEPVLETSSAPAPESKPDLEPDLENFIIEPASGIAESKGGEMDLKDENPEKEDNSAAQNALESTLSESNMKAPAPEEPGLVLEQAASPFTADTPAASAPGEEDKTLVIPPASSGPQDALDNTLSSPFGQVAQTPQVEVPALEPQPAASSPQEFALDVKESAPAEPALGIERPNSAFGVPAAAAPSDDDKTMVMAPPSGSDGDKTVIYEAGSDMGATSRRREDLGTISAKSVPDGIPPERVRTVAFLYAQEDAALCSDLLSELDAICLKSASKPMFVKRAFVQVCEPGTNGNAVMQKVTDAKALGLVLLGSVPQENVYEIENAFTAGGAFFRHIPKENFSHSAALDLVTEFILK